MKRMTDENLDLLETVPEARTNVFRERRKILLSALDIYDKNVSKGRITETEYEKAIVDKWYKALLDLEEWAFTQIPETVKKYL